MRRGVYVNYDVRDKKRDTRTCDVDVVKSSLTSERCGEKAVSMIRTVSAESSIETGQPLCLCRSHALCLIKDLAEQLEFTAEE